MRFMVIVKADNNSEAGVLSDEKFLGAMRRYNDELKKAGVLLAIEGLHPSSEGVRVKFSGAKRTVIDGPFAETKELIAGYWLWQVGSKEEAIEWIKRAPFNETEVEIREISVPCFLKLSATENATSNPRAQGERVMTQVKPIPEGMHTVTPHLVCAGAADAIEFYKKAFDAVEGGRLPAPDGKLAHAMIRINGSPVMLVDEFPEWGSFGPKSLRGSPVTIHLYVEDVDAFVARAVGAGAKITMPLEDMFWGDRYCKLEDPFGHHWSVATHVRDVDREEMERAMQKGCS